MSGSPARRGRANPEPFPPAVLEEVEGAGPPAVAPPSRRGRYLALAGAGCAALLLAALLAGGVGLAAILRGAGPQDQDELRRRWVGRPLPELYRELGRPERVGPPGVGVVWKLRTRDPRTGRVSRYVHAHPWAAGGRGGSVGAYESMREAQALESNALPGAVREVVGDLSFSDGPDR
jgi:hypothetical protein